MSNILDRFFANLANLHALQEMIASDAVIIGVRAQTYEALPIYGTFHGPDGFMTFLGHLRDSFDTQSFVVEDTLVADGRGYAKGHFAHKVRATGRLFVSTWALYAEFENDRLSLYRFHEDTAALEEAMEVRTASTEVAE